ncbi:MAG: carboxypeptidase-like regulatory domain-containing protein, partial [Planctomycetota bacterium]
MFTSPLTHVRIALLATVATVTIIAISPPTAADEAASKPAVQTIKVRVINRQTKEPLAGAKIKFRYDCNKEHEYTTDRNGYSSVIIPPAGEIQMRHFSLVAGMEKFVPLSRSWNIEKQGMPNQYTFALAPGTSLGGVIRNEASQPIQGATVTFSISDYYKPDQDQVALCDHQVKTDAQGHWRCDIMPAKLHHVSLRLSHPDYISDYHYQESRRPPIDKLRDMTAIMVMKKGVKATGKVMDEEGQPLEGVQVTQRITQYTHMNDNLNLTTDRQGQFICRPVEPGETIALTAHAKNLAPDLKVIDIRRDMKPVEFRLQKGKVLRGRIVDKKGKPVSEANVDVDMWGEFRSLKKKMKTDKDGRFQWNNAPPDTIKFNIAKNGYMSIRNHEMAPSDQEQVITLPDPLKIAGTVTDAETSKPIPEFTLIKGYKWDKDREPYFFRHDAQQVRTGKYEVTLTYSLPFHALRIEADNYFPVISPLFTSQDGEQVYNFKLTKGQNITGTVVSPDGTEIADAEVVLCEPDNSVTINNGRLGYQ